MSEGVKKGWHSGYSTQRRGYTWVEFSVGSLPCSERFSPGYLTFPASQNPSILIRSQRNAQTR